MSHFIRVTTTVAVNVDRITEVFIAKPKKRAPYLAVNLDDSGRGDSDSCIYAVDEDKEANVFEATELPDMEAALGDARAEYNTEQLAKP